MKTNTNINNIFIEKNEILKKYEKSNKAWIIITFCVLLINNIVKLAQYMKPNDHDLILLFGKNWFRFFLYFIKTFDKSCAFTQYIIDNHKNKWLKTRNF